MDFIFDNIDRLNEEKKKNVFLNRFSYGDEEDPNVYMLREEMDNGAEKRTVIYAPNYVLEKYSNRGGYPLENGGVAYWSPEIMRALSMNNVQVPIRNTVRNINNKERKNDLHNSSREKYKYNYVNDNINSYSGTKSKNVGGSLINKSTTSAIALGLGTYGSLKYSPDVKTALFAIKHPMIAYDIGTVFNNSRNISTSASRFATREEILRGSKKKEMDEGSENGAVRHVLWQAKIASKYGNEIAKNVGNVHEVNPNVDLSIRKFSNISDADQTVDLLNNEIGRKIGTNYRNYNMHDLALIVLKEFKDNGLYTAEKGNDGFWHVEKRKLSKELYEKIYNVFNILDSNGYYPDETKGYIKRTIKKYIY